MTKGHPSDMYRTNLYSKKLNIRNNVKNAMIQEFLFKLHGSMDDTSNSITSVQNISWFSMPPINGPIANPCIEWSPCRDEIPCLNTNCEWIQHMLLYYATYDLFLLPGNSGSGYCIVCNKIMDGTLNRSMIKLQSKNEVSLQYI